MDKGQLVPDSLVLEMVAEKLCEPQFAKGCLFDGFPRTLAQARALDDSLMKRCTPLNLVLELRADEEELINRMFLNLIENAVKFTSAGGRVRVLADRLPQSYSIRVIDDGPGIPAAEQPRVFERFYRSDRVRRDPEARRPPHHGCVHESRRQALVISRRACRAAEARASQRCRSRPRRG